MLVCPEENVSSDDRSTEDTGNGKLGQVGAHHIKFRSR
jgi:hypothetical protein